MSYGLFVYFKRMPNDFADTISAGLKSHGFDLPLKITADQERKRITVGEPTDIGDGEHDGLDCWVNAIDKHAEAASELRAAADGLNDKLLAEHLHNAAYEIHFSHQYLSGHRGEQLMYVAAAVIASAADGGIIFDPQSDAYLSANEALAGMKSEAAESNESTAAQVIERDSSPAPKRAQRVSTNTKSGMIFLLVILLVVLYKFSKL